MNTSITLYPIGTNQDYYDVVADGRSIGQVVIQTSGGNRWAGITGRGGANPETETPICVGRTAREAAEGLHRVMVGE